MAPVADARITTLAREWVTQLLCRGTKHDAIVHEPAKNRITLRFNEIRIKREASGTLVEYFFDGELVAWRLVTPGLKENDTLTLTRISGSMEVGLV